MQFHPKPHAQPDNLQSEGSHKSGASLWGARGSWPTPVPHHRDLQPRSDLLPKCLALKTKALTNWDISSRPAQKRQFKKCPHVMEMRLTILKLLSMMQGPAGTLSGDRGTGKYQLCALPLKGRADMPWLCALQWPCKSWQVSPGPVISH